MLRALGLFDFLQECSRAADPVQHFLDGIDNVPEQDTDNLPYGLSFHDFFCIWYSLVKSLTAYGFYARTLSRLVEDVRGGNDAALFKAVRVDRSAVSCPTIAHRITRAEIERGKRPRFFKKLQGVMRGGSGHYKDSLSPLRFILWALDEAGGLEKLSGDDRYKLFCLELKVYPFEREDRSDGLKKFIQRWLQTAERFSRQGT